MSKTIFSCYTKADSVERLRTLSAESGAPIGDLLGLLIDYGAERLSLEKLRAWALQREGRKTRSASGLRKDDQAVLRALGDLREREKSADPPVFRFDTEVIAAQAGLRAAVAYGRLSALKQKGLVGCFCLKKEEDGTPMLDQWGRMQGAAWYRMEDHEEWIRARESAQSEG